MKGRTIMTTSHPPTPMEFQTLFKHDAGAEFVRPPMTLAQPNLNHEHMTQDELRASTIKFLTPDQRRHFNLKTELNRRGSLFGPKRDQRRENTPPYNDGDETEIPETEEEASDIDCENTASYEQLLPAAPPASVRSIATATTAFPMTNMSLRGSDVEDDMKLLDSVRPSSDKISVTLPLPLVSRASMTSRKAALDLDRPDLFNISDWLKMEEKGEYLGGKRKHFLRVINTLDYDEKVMQVSNYQLLHELVTFYAQNYNSNAHNYVWKDIWGNTLELYKSLAENDLMDHSLIIDELGLDHFPTILLYFKDGFENEPLMRLDISKPEPNGIIVPCRNY